MVQAKTKEEFINAYSWHINSLSVLWNNTDSKTMKRIITIQDELKEIVKEIADKLDFEEIKKGEK